MKAWMAKALHRLVRRDALVLNPRWRLIHRSDDLMIAAPIERVNEDTLPVLYEFHAERPLHIRYHIAGSECGELRITIQLANDTGWSGRITLPVQIALEEIGAAVCVNGVRISNAPSREVSELRVAFEFTAASGNRSTRQVVHRLKRPASDAEYFKGGVYADYESDPGMEPDAVLDRLAAIRPLRGSFLDIGCATGLLVSRAKRKGLDASGVDASTWAIQQARARTEGKYWQLDIETATAADLRQLYTFVTAHSVLEHLANPERALRLVYDILEPGGIALIQTLNAGSAMHRLQLTSWSGYSDPTHRSPWLTQAWLDQTTREVGFRVIEQRCYGVWNDRAADPVWRAVGQLLQTPPASTVLREGLGDFLELILQKPA